MEEGILWLRRVSKFFLDNTVRREYNRVYRGKPAYRLFSLQRLHSHDLPFLDDPTHYSGTKLNGDFERVFA